MIDNFLEWIEKWKKELLISLVTLIIPGTAYGLYIKYYLKPVGKIAYSQAEAYGDTAKCALLLNSNDIVEIGSYFKGIELKKDELQHSDAGLSAIGTVASGGKNIPSGMGASLNLCNDLLKQHFRDLEFKKEHNIQ